MRRLDSVADALALLRELGATPWLIRHHELVVEAATQLCDDFERRLEHVDIDRARILLGAALHDAGKIVVPDEMHAPGHRHERAGYDLLVRSNVAADVARFCITHAQWSSPVLLVSMADLLVALADKLWKGKRDEALEKQILDAIAPSAVADRWQAFDTLDAICEGIAAGGPHRLARSSV